MRYKHYFSLYVFFLVSKKLFLRTADHTASFRVVRSMTQSLSKEHADTAASVEIFLGLADWNFANANR